MKGWQSIRTSGSEIATRFNELHVKIFMFVLQQQKCISCPSSMYINLQISTHIFYLSWVDCVKGLAWDWLKSSIYNRSQAVIVNNNTSSKSLLHLGVPQASILGPILFNIFSLSIANIAHNLGLFAHAYADNINIPIK